MKTAAVCASPSAKAPSSSAGKHRRPPGDQGGEEEMQACFARLMQLVPTVAPCNGRMSKVQLLQHVIDYILDLEYTLDFRPGKPESAADRVTEAADGLRGPGSPPPPATPGPSPPPIVERKPLTENAQVNSGRGHQSSQQQTFYFERQPSITWS